MIDRLGYRGLFICTSSLKVLGGLCNNCTGCLCLFTGVKAASQVGDAGIIFVGQDSPKWVDNENSGFRKGSKKIPKRKGKGRDQ